jgi:hypothetical protein
MKRLVGGLLLICISTCLDYFYLIDRRFLPSTSCLKFACLVEEDLGRFIREWTDGAEPAHGRLACTPLSADS